MRRSYSRLSGDASFSSPGQQSPGSSVASRRETLFGFEKMQTPKVMRSMCLSATAPQASSSLCGVVSLNLSEAEDSVNHSVEPDYNIPGVVIAKKQSRKKRVQPMKVGCFSFHFISSISYCIFLEIRSAVYVYPSSLSFSFLWQ